ncbi:hypothetical protein [Deinococcus hopiensis]|uniref:hypothetical protein n=1 Tax=Deinococcus hopiensis TaxID=309885 RepID=UPI00111C34CF|nr:hypothetical protein [Deinococcus hopiensis]
MTAELGTIHAVQGGILALHHHPRLYNASTGVLITQWPDLKTGEQQSSIIRHIGRPPPFAMDTARSRFAVGTEEGVTVLSLGA